VATLRRWWETMGKALYPTAGRLLVCADAGGCNGYRIRAWKTQLARLVAETGLAITVCHFPPGRRRRSYRCQVAGVGTVWLRTVNSSRAT